MSSKFAKAYGDGASNERKTIAALLEAAVHGRAVVFLCHDKRAATYARDLLVQRSRSIENRYAEPTMVTTDEVHFKSGGCVRFLVSWGHQHGYHFDGVAMDEVMWI